jgi:hypothetical protein
VRWYYPSSWEKHENTFLLPNGYRDRFFWISRANSIRFLFVGLDEVRSWHTKGGYTRRILDAATRVKKREDQLRRTTAISHTSCKVHWGVLWTVTNLSFKHSFTTKTKCKVSNIFITIQYAFVFGESVGCVSVTIQNWTHVHMNFFSHFQNTSTVLPESPCA